MKFAAFHEFHSRKVPTNRINSAEVSEKTCVAREGGLHASILLRDGYEI